MKVNGSSEMKFAAEHCPECGDDAYGVVETMPVVTRLFPVEYDSDGKGDYDYHGDSDVCWDASESPCEEEGVIRLMCREGHMWDTYVAFGEE
jgi:hypothetical protein